MKLHQLRFVREAVRQNYNLTDTARALHTSQPGVSKAILELEKELGLDIFIRHGKRILGLTEPGSAVLKAAELIMQETEKLNAMSQEFAEHDSGNLTIATTHTQARYILPKVVQAFMKKFPKVRLSLLQGNPKQVSDMVLNGQADLGIATEAIINVPELSTMPCYEWSHMVVVPVGHSLLKSKKLTLKELAAYPLITYDSAFAGRTKIDSAFAVRSFKPDILLEAIDADVIKTYVELGLGVGIIASMAYDPLRDQTLRAIPAGHLFGKNISRVALKQGAYLRSYVFTFIELLSPALSRQSVEQIVSNDKNR